MKTKPLTFLICGSLFLIIGYLFLITNPFGAASCWIKGGSYKRQGMRSRFCEIKAADAGKSCYSNSECSTSKCVIGKFGQRNGHLEGKVINPRGQDKVVLFYGGKITDEEIMGVCAATNQSPCYTAEMLIKEDRTIYTPPICE